MGSGSNRSTTAGSPKGGPALPQAQAPRCRGCGRHPQECWILLPCLDTEVASPSAVGSGR